LYYDFYFLTYIYTFKLITMLAQTITAFQSLPLDVVGRLRNLQRDIEMVTAVKPTGFTSM